MRSGLRLQERGTATGALCRHAGLARDAAKHDRLAADNQSVRLSGGHPGQEGLPKILVGWLGGERKARSARCWLAEDSAACLHLQNTYAKKHTLGFPITSGPAWSSAESTMYTSCVHAVWNTHVPGRLP